MAIQKTSGCNKMVCTNCSTRFCWKCEKEISGYDHFSAMTCILFDQAEIDEWNAMMVMSAPDHEQPPLLLLLCVGVSACLLSPLHVQDCGVEGDRKAMELRCERNCCCCCRVKTKRVLGRLIFLDGGRLISEPGVTTFRI